MTTDPNLSFSTSRLDKRHLTSYSKLLKQKKGAQALLKAQSFLLSLKSSTQSFKKYRSFESFDGPI